LKAAELEQRQIIQQISDRATEGRPRLAALDDMLDTIEDRRAGLEARLNQAPEEEDFGGRIRKLKAEVSPQAVERIINSAFYYMREHADTETKQPYILHQCIRKVVIVKTPGHQPASLKVHGRIAGILRRQGDRNDTGEAVRGTEAPRSSGEASRRRGGHGAETQKAPRRLRGGAFYEAT